MDHIPESVRYSKGEMPVRYRQHALNKVDRKSSVSPLTTGGTKPFLARERDPFYIFALTTEKTSVPIPFCATIHYSKKNGYNIGC